MISWVLYIISSIIVSWTLSVVIAKFIIVVVFPSPGPGLEIIITLLFLGSVAVYNKLVLRLLYDSDIGDFGSSNVISLLCKIPID